MKHTKRLLSIVMPIVAVICSVVFIPWEAVWLWATPLPDTVQEQVDKAIGRTFDGIIVYIDTKGSNPEFYAAGWKNREHKVKADPHALFKIGSISKLYIAAAAAKLVNNKRLSLDKTLAAYLPEFAGRIENADQITLRMLLQHRSGIPDFIDSPKLPWDKLPADANGFLKLVLDKPADFKPDSRYRYSNTNYLLIGDILDKTLGYSHRQYIKKEILDPLGLTHTYGLLNEVDLKEMVSGYYIGYNGDLKTQNFVSPGGSMVATAQDVGIFLRALNDSSLLNGDEQAIYSSIYAYEHTGLLPGYSSIARYYKDIDTVVIVFVNTSGGNSWAKLEIVYNRIVRILHKQLPKR
ncbi:serine hydrolase domain-containing protein [Chitinophaga arvensicola]|uniref:CubicO group peptidase, beta-lactamase class C family n=1 Tax=Chitinophaga arvensicola TaxID=29529 RepID=A0A1I0S9S3_9BACT|nr:serine hydrolase domain-containing protein [Chitinophaga arvensicola]SEW52849.1 CubicO group peptidase, beta-lactamase class C family [Chitinophaga arvensicola]